MFMKEMVKARIIKNAMNMMKMFSRHLFYFQPPLTVEMSCHVLFKEC